MHKAHFEVKKVRQKRVKSSQMIYPPQILDEQFEGLISDIKDWQITHGSLLKVMDTDNGHTIQSYPVGTSLFPTLFPQELFDEACEIQKTYNKLYAAVAEDEEWLFDILKNIIDVDPLANKLWTIYLEVKKEGHLQDLSLGIFRSDYMIHLPPDTQVKAQLKQVEFNTIACAGGIHSSNISSMHQHLLRMGSYDSPLSPQVTTFSLPPNNTPSTLAGGLVSAHRAYGAATSRIAKETCIIMIVQPNNFNIADERPIEYCLWDASIPCFRVTFGYEVLVQTSLTLNRELLYNPPHRSTPLEVSVVYFRSGFEVEEYADDMGHMARFQLEKSKAIKCPNLLGHLSTFKKVQQALTVPGMLEKYLTLEESRRLEKTFVSMWPLDESEEGQQARRFATDPITAARYVLKPSLEGGGHNIYGADIPGFLAKLPKELWHTYVLMEKIVPPLLNNTVMGSQGLCEGPVVSELGVFGICLWKSNRGTGKAVVMEEKDPCWSFKTKMAEVDEMSVVKGYGYFDSPALVGGKVFETLAGNDSR